MIRSEFIDATEVALSSWDRRADRCGIEGDANRLQYDDIRHSVRLVQVGSVPLIKSRTSVP